MGRGRRTWIEAGADLELRDVPGDATPGRPSMFPLPPRHASFVRASAPPGVLFTLKVATWGDGSRVFLDSRGLLHFVSADKKLPQLTLVLSSRPIAGWTSDGRTFGWSYFLPNKATDDVSLGASLLREFTRRLP
jgi:hypothetical protein